MRPHRLLVLLLLAALAAGCVRRASPPVAEQASADLDSLTYGIASRAPAAKTTQNSTAADAAAASPQMEEPYRLDSGDKLRVIVFGQEGLTNSYAVDAGGAITMPLIGSIRARGLTTVELSRAISAKLRQGYIREPHVAVEIETYRPFFILGEVTYPGQYPYVANMTVETAVAIAGGFSPRAQRARVDLSRTVNGETVRRSVPLDAPVRPGDTIVVAERWF